MQQWCDNENVTFFHMHKSMFFDEFVIHCYSWAPAYIHGHPLGEEIGRLPPLEKASVIIK